MPKNKRGSEVLAGLSSDESEVDALLEGRPVAAKRSKIMPARPPLDAMSREGFDALVRQQVQQEVSQAGYLSIAIFAEEFEGLKGEFKEKIRELEQMNRQYSVEIAALAERCFALESQVSMLKGVGLGGAQEAVLPHTPLAGYSRPPSQTFAAQTQGIQFLHDSQQKKYQQEAMRSPQSPSFFPLPLRNPLSGGYKSEWMPTVFHPSGGATRGPASKSDSGVEPKW